MILAPLSAVLLGSQLVVAVASRVPTFDVRPSCRAAAADTPSSYKSCMSDEHAAQRTLRRTWSRFKPADRATCLSTTESDGTPSYVEVLTCLQMAKDAEGLPKNLRQ